MTNPAKRLIVDLLNGGYLLPWKRPSGTNCYRLYLGKANPVRNVRTSTVGAIKCSTLFDVLNTDKKTNKITIARSQVRKLRGNHSIKKIYKRMLKGHQVTITNKPTNKNETNKGERDTSGQIQIQFKRSL